MTGEYKLGPRFPGHPDGSSDKWAFLFNDVEALEKLDKVCGFRDHKWNDKHTYPELLDNIRRITHENPMGGELDSMHSELCGFCRVERISFQHHGFWFVIFSLDPKAEHPGIDEMRRLLSPYGEWLEDKHE